MKFDHMQLKSSHGYK